MQQHGALSSGSVGDDYLGKWAKIEMPAWFFGGAPAQFFQRAGLVARLHNGSANAGWRVTTEENYYKRSSRLVEAGPIQIERGHVSPHSRGLIAALLHDDVERPVLTSARDRIEQELGRLPENAIVAASHAARLRVSSALGLPQLEDAIVSAVSGLGSITFDDTGEPALGHIETWAILRANTVHYRLRFMAVLLRISVDEELAAGDTSAVAAAVASGKMPAFGSSRYLTDGSVMLDPYLGPLVSSLTPSIWGVLCPRVNGTVLISLGRSVAGTTPIPQSMLETVMTRGADEPYAAPTFVRSDAPQAAVAWWTNALDALFSWMTDPALYVDDRGTFDPLAQLETVASIEQVFRRMLSIQTLHRDRTARMTLMFGVLDSLENLTGVSGSKMYSADHAVKCLAGLEASVGKAHEVLLPAANRAVDALRGVASGFFLSDQHGRIPLRDGKPAMGPGEAAAEYLGMLRNAVHGFGSDRAARWEVDANLMARHTGDIPHDLALLPWLYLLDMLANPVRMRSITAKRNHRQTQG